MCIELVESAIEKIRAQIKESTDWLEDSVQVEAEWYKHEEYAEVEYERGLQSGLLREFAFLPGLSTAEIDLLENPSNVCLLENPSKGAQE